MSAVAGSVAPVNGISSHPAGFDEAVELEKILRICHQITTRTHPRLKPPSQLVQGKPSQPPAKSSLSQPKHPSPPPNNIVRQLPGLQSSGQPKPQTPVVPNSISKPTPSQFLQVKHSPAELDPIFLQKSDHLVQAEIKLQRERLEKQLREQLDHKRNWARQHTSPEEAKPDFDVEETLAKAVKLVKPIPAKSLKLIKTPSDSFDEDSLYSSKAPDSTPRGGDVIERSPVAGPQVPPLDIDGNDADGPVDHHYDVLHQADHADRIIKRHDHSTPQKRRSPVTIQRPRNGARESDDTDEPEYSPPEPTRFVDLGGDTAPYVNNGVQSNRRYSAGRYSDIYNQGGRRHESPAPDPRIVRNHISSPIAPQPSRISPLTLVKAPPAAQKRYRRSDDVHQRQIVEPESLRTSPDVPLPTMQPRKRRKLRDEAPKRGSKGKRRAAMSPDPVIKDEPVSPPPFHDVPPLSMQGHLQRREGPVYIDVDPPVESRYSPAPPRMVEYQPRRTVYEVESPAPRSEQMPYSRAPAREPHRDDQDLRRIASLRNMRNEYPLERPQSVAHSQPQHYSREPAVLAREPYTGPERRVIYEDPVPEYHRRVVREASPMVSQNREVYAAEARTPQLMPPPQRRIVVDEAGNRYYENIPPPREYATATLPKRRLEMGDHEGADFYSGSLRAASVVVEEPYRERRYVEEMAPPQGYRRVTDVQRAGTVERRPFPREELERQPIARSGSVQFVDYPPRQAMYVDDRAAPSQEIVRMSSVRPPPSRYEEPQVQRVQSVRPEARDYAIIDDQPQLRREYTPVSRPTYEIRRDPRGNVYETGDGRRVLVGETMPGRHSVAPGY